MNMINYFLVGGKKCDGRQMTAIAYRQAFQDEKKDRLLVIGMTCSEMKKE